MTICDRGLTQSKLSIKKCILGKSKSLGPEVAWSPVSPVALQPLMGGVIGMENLEMYCKQAMEKRVNLSCSKI